MYSCSLSHLLIVQAAKSVAEAAPLLEVHWDERLLVHIGYSPLRLSGLTMCSYIPFQKHIGIGPYCWLTDKMYSRWTCRNCSLASNITSGNIRPCDFKMGKILSTRQAFRCTYDFDWRWTFLFAGIAHFLNHSLVYWTEHVFWFHSATFQIKKEIPTISSN